VYIKTEEHKRKIGEAHKGKKHSKEWKENISKGHKGLHHSEEHKRKIGEALKGIPISEERREKLIKANTGSHHSAETREKLSKSRARRVGVKSPNWKGGVTTENNSIRSSIEYGLWRESVFARDNWTCQKCKQKGGILNAHHVKTFAQCHELRTSIQNGVTFCKECHKKFHKKYGRRDNNEEQINCFTG